MGARHNKAAGFTLKKKGAMLVATSEVRLPDRSGTSGVANPNATFLTNDFLALDSPPLTSRNSDEKRGRQRKEAGRKSINTAAVSEGADVRKIDVRIRGKRLKMHEGSLSPEMKSVCSSPKTEILSANVSRSSVSPHKPFQGVLLKKLHMPQTSDLKVEFTADSHREAPYENIKYQRKGPIDRPGHSNASYKLIHRRSRSDDLIKFYPQTQSRDMMNLLKQVVDVGLDTHNLKSRSVAMVKVLQTTPPRSTPKTQKMVRQMAKKVDNGEAKYVIRPKNAFIIQPKVQIPTDITKPSDLPKSRAEHQWHWKGRYGLSPQSSPKASPKAER